MTASRTGAPDTVVDGWDARPLIEADEAELARRFPGAVLWFGAFTRRWWAFLKDQHGTWRLLEANGPTVRD